MLHRLDRETACVLLPTTRRELDLRLLLVLLVNAFHRRADGEDEVLQLLQVQSSTRQVSREEGGVGFVQREEEARSSGVGRD